MLTLGGVIMAKNIFRNYTEDQNKTCGRKGYFRWKRERDVGIPPNRYGMFLDKERSRKRNA